MELPDYFEEKTGIGVLATADAEGKVNAALYARPHFSAEGSAVFIMGDGLTHRNLQSNPHAAYIFIESGPGYQGKRLYLTREREEEDPDLIDGLRRRSRGTCIESKHSAHYVGYFHVDRVLPLVGTAE